MIVVNPPWIDEGAPHVWRPYCQHLTAPPPLPVASARGSRLVLEGGAELVDGIASWWTAAHGYGHPHIRARVAEQLDRLPHVAFGGLAHEPAYTLARRLSAVAPPGLTRVFFTESGSVAVEVALKMALQAFHNRQGDATRRHTIVAFEGAYHGDTFATMSLCDPLDGMHAAFASGGIRTLHFPIPTPGDDTFESAFAAVAPEIAAVVIEPLVQCAGGMRMHDPASLRRVQAACNEHGVPLIADEIATGFHRTGPRFAVQAAGVSPDILVIGKALTGGTLPLAATLAREEIFDAFLGEDPTFALQHGPTYMANALACAAAHASLDLFENDDYAGRAAALESVFRTALEPLRAKRSVRDVRVRGAIAAIEMEPGSAPPSSTFAERGAFVRPLRLRHADVVYLMPPLLIEPSDLEVLLAAVRTI